MAMQPVSKHDPLTPWEVVKIIRCGHKVVTAKSSRDAARWEREADRIIEAATKREEERDARRRRE